MDMKYQPLTQVVYDLSSATVMRDGHIVILRASNKSLDQSTYVLGFKCALMMSFGCHLIVHLIRLMKQFKLVILAKQNVQKLNKWQGTQPGFYCHTLIASMSGLADEMKSTADSHAEVVIIVTFTRDYQRGGLLCGSRAVTRRSCSIHLPLLLFG